MKCRQKAVRLVHIYQFKFNEYFQKYSQYFFLKIWDMVTHKHAAACKQNEKLIQAIIRYLSEMSTYPDLTEFFKSNMLSLF